MLYKVKQRGFGKETLTSIYFALFYSHLSYGLDAWGFAKDEYLQKVIITQNKAVRAILEAKNVQIVLNYIKISILLNLKTCFI